MLCDFHPHVFMEIQHFDTGNATPNRKEGLAEELLTTNKMVKMLRYGNKSTS